MAANGDMVQTIAAQFLGTRDPRRESRGQRGVEGTRVVTKVTKVTH